MTLPFSQQTGLGDEHEEEAEVTIIEALPCTDDNNDDYEYTIAMEEEDYCVVKMDEEKAEVREALPCTDTTDDNNDDYEYDTAMEEEDYCKDKTELVVNPT